MQFRVPMRFTALAIQFCWIGLFWLLAVGSPSARAALGAAQEANDRPPVATKLTCALLNADSSPLSTLVETQLLKRDDEAWVERARIDAVLAERKLQSVMAADAGMKRAELGRLLNAQILVILQTGAKKNPASVEIVVCETEQGLRLLCEAIPLSGNAADEAKTLIAAVDQALGRFRDTIREIYAVPPFVSKNLVYEHDYLRTAYARLVERILLQRPGALVVELAEAEAIAREAALAGQTPNRRLPVMILGQYRHQGQGESLRVAIDLRACQGEKELASVSETILEADAQAFFRKALATLIKADGKLPPAAAPDQESRQLLRRAAEHQQMGNWQEAISLLEAGLLIKPNQPEAHREAVLAISGLLLAMSPYRAPYDIDVFRRYQQAYRRGLYHLEAAVRAGAVPRVTKPWVDIPFFSRYRFQTKRPLGPCLPAELNRLVKQVEDENRETLTRLARLFAERGNFRDASLYLQSALADLHTADKYACILNILREYPGTTWSQIDIILWAGADSSLGQLRTVEGRRFLADLAQMPGAAPQTRANAQALLEAAHREPLPARPVEEAFRVFTPALVTAPNELWFRHVQMKQGVDSGDVRSLAGERCIPAGEGIDFFWNNTFLYLMKKKDVLRIVGPRIWSQSREVVFDGRYLWVATPCDPALRILVIEPISEQWWELSAKDGLPLPRSEELPANKRRSQHIAMAPLSPGKVCMAGGFGRTWLAIVTFDPAGHHQVRIFHEATEVQKENDQEQWKKSTVAFTPSIIVKLLEKPGPDGKRATRLLVARDAPQSIQNLSLYYHPLLVDPEKLSVAVVQHQFHFPGNFDVYDGAMYATWWDSPTQLAVHRIELPELQARSVMTIEQDGFLVFADNRLNVAGKQWWIGRLADGQLACAGDVPWHCRSNYREDIVKGNGPNRGEIQSISKSNHYGLLARCQPSDGFYQVLLGKEAEAARAADGGKPVVASPQPPPRRVRDSSVGTSLEAMAAAFPLTREEVAAAGMCCPQPFFSFRSRTHWPLAMSPDHRLIAANVNDRTILLWSVADARPLRTITAQESFGRRGPAFSPDGQSLAMVDARWDTAATVVKVWNTDSGNLSASLPFPRSNVGVSHLSFSGDGLWLIASGYDGESYVWNLRTGKFEYRTHVFSGAVRSLPHGSLLVTANDSRGSLLAWDLASGTARKIADQCQGEILAVSPNGSQLAVQQLWRPVNDRMLPMTQVLVCDLRSQKVVATIDSPDIRGRNVVAAFSEDGAQLTTIPESRPPSLWNVADGKQIRLPPETKNSQ